MACLWLFMVKFLLPLLIILSSHVTEGSRRSLMGLHGTFDGLDETLDNGTSWAVLIAGSSGYGNYRHQADVCHAYQILKRGGLKDENIIVFMYDDIANNTENPHPGIIINKPNGHDVYAGVPKDYTGEDVNVDNFLAVVLGNKTAVIGGSGKIVASKPNDRIFIYYTDHGGPGVLGMPSMPYLYAKDFIEVLKKKHATGTYKEMVIYVEACESGSIFEGLLPGNLNIYVTTASNATENSWGTYCPGMKPPPPPEYDTCLGDLYSISWMEDSDIENLAKETLQHQYEKVKLRTYNNHSDEGSNVMQYGTMSMSSETVSTYQGFSNSNVTEKTFFSGPMGVVNQRDADLVYMWHKYAKLAEGSQKKAELLQQITGITSHRVHLDRSINKIGTLLFGEQNGASVLHFLSQHGLPIVDDWGCLKSMVRSFETHCGSLTQYGMKHMRAFANICNNHITLKSMEGAASAACSKYELGDWSPTIRGYSA